MKSIYHFHPKCDQAAERGGSRQLGGKRRRADRSRRRKGRARFVCRLSAHLSLAALDWKGQFQLH